MILAMKKIVLLALLLISFSGNICAQTEMSAQLNIRFENLETAKGYIRLALYRSVETFMDEEKAELFNFRVEKEGTMEGQIKGLEPGTYAFAIFHDKDEDNILNTNFFGIPKEPYGFSRQSPSKWRPPTFGEAKFEVVAGKNELTVPLQRFSF